MSLTGATPGCRLCAMTDLSATHPLQPRRRRSPVIAIAVVALVALTAAVWRIAAVSDSGDRSNSEQDRPSEKVRQALQLADTDPAAALELLEQVPQNHRDYLLASRHAARIAMSAKDMHRAERALRVLERTDANDFAVQLSLAELLHSSDRSREALPHAERALELKPERVDSYLLYAEILDNLHRVEEMIAPLENAVRLDAQRLEAHANLAYALHYSGRLEDAEREARWCLERQPRLATIRGLLARIERDRGRHDAALAEVRRALDVAEDDVELRILEAELLIYAGDHESAYTRLLPLLDVHRRYRPFLATLSRAALLSGRHAAARGFEVELRSLINERRETEFTPDVP